MECRAVLFDFDGVLIQSIEDHHRSWNSVFKEYGAVIGWDEFASLEGQSLYWISQRLCQNHGIDMKHAHPIASQKNEIYKKSMAVTFYDGALELLAHLQPRVRLGLVTGAHRDRLEHTVDEGFKSLFGTIVTADDVATKKPSPEPYLRAATGLQVLPAQCVVVENAPFGIESACRAGMKCVAVRSTLGDSFLSKADWIVDDIAQTRLVIGSLI